MIGGRQYRATEVSALRYINVILSRCMDISRGKSGGGFNFCRDFFLYPRARNIIPAWRKLYFARADTKKGKSGMGFDFYRHFFVSTRAKYNFRLAVRCWPLNVQG